MKIVQQNGGVLSNHEVAQVLEERGADPNAGLNARATASEKTVYAELLKQCGGRIKSREQLQALVEALKPFGLSRAELVQVINLAPTSPVEVHLVVEECEQRLPEEGRVDKLLAVVGQHLGPQGAAPQGAAQAQQQ